MNKSYLPIGGAILLAIKKTGSRSLPLTHQSKVFENTLLDRRQIPEKDSLHAIAWDDGENFIFIEDEKSVRIPVCLSRMNGMKDLSRIKTLVSLANKKIRLHQAVKMIPVWSEYMNMNVSNAMSEDLLPAEQERWMRQDKKIDLFLDIEAEYNNAPKLSEMEKLSINKLVSSLQNKDVGLYKVAAQVDSMPVDIGSGKHLAFLINEIALVERVS